ncbi:MAG: hypothetical protein AB7O80_14855 [Acetobacteraceae bacterium]
MLDLSAKRSVRVDPSSRIARVETGALLNDFNREAKPFSLATTDRHQFHHRPRQPDLGKGFGWLSRTHGLPVNNFLAAGVVTAAGELLHPRAVTPLAASGDPIANVVGPTLPALVSGGTTVPDLRRGPAVIHAAPAGVR